MRTSPVSGLIALVAIMGFLICSAGAMEFDLVNR